MGEKPYLGIVLVEDLRQLAAKPRSLFHVFDPHHLVVRFAAAGDHFSGKFDDRGHRTNIDDRIG